MGIKGRAGWVAAAAFAAAWYFAADKDAPSSVPPPAPSTKARAPVSPPPPKSAEEVVAIVRPSRSVNEDLPPAAVSKPMFTTTRVRLRDQPGTSGRILITLDAGELIQSHSLQDGWHQVSARNRIGWVNGDYLSEEAPAAAPSVAAPLAAPVIKRAAERPTKPQRRTGKPIREAYVGVCDCPYDRKRNGHRCGGTSAYSRPGGRSPECFVGD